MTLEEYSADLIPKLTAPLYPRLTPKPISLYTKGEAVRNGSVDYIAFADWEDNRCIFFPSNYCFQSKLLPGSWVHGSMGIPHRIKAREGYEDGIVHNLDQWLDIYEKGTVVLETIEQLVEWCYINHIAVGEV